MSLSIAYWVCGTEGDLSLRGILIGCFLSVFVWDPGASLQAAPSSFQESPSRPLLAVQAADSLESRDAIAFSSIPSVREPVDSIGVPVRLGDTVAVAGRASAAVGRFGDARRVFLQHRNAGIALHFPEQAAGDDPPIARGDSVWARGVVDHSMGLTMLRVLDYGIPDVPAEPPSPVVASLESARGERYEGTLVHLHGTVFDVGGNRGGKYLLLRTSETEQVLSIFVVNQQLRHFDIDAFEAGDRVDVTGVLVQHDFTAPYDDYYEVYPRTSDDLVRVAASVQTYRNLGIAAAVLVLIGLLVIVGLRREIKRRTRQVAESRARFRRLAEATFEGIVIHRDGEILDVNQALTRMVGYGRDELIGRNALDFLTEATRSCVRESVNTQRESPYEAVIVRKDGTTFPAEIEAKVVDKEGDRLRIAAIRDITKRKQDEAELLLAKEEAEQMAQLKSSLLNNMSHELRTPITSIIGYAELIMDEPPETHTAFARHIRESGKRLAETLQSVLDMAQIEAGTLDLSVRDVDVGVVAEEAVADHQPFAADKDIDLTVACCGSCCLRSDRTLVYRILSNLVHNAVKFTEEGRVQVSIERTESGVKITVADTGVGIGEDFRPHVFEPFKQESNGRSRDYQGTGLGLAITKHMVDLLGGEIRVESTKGAGSTFAVTLPTGRTANPSASASKESAAEPVWDP